MIDRLATYIPLISVLQNYSSKALKADLIAGLTVGIVLIPQGMAYAVIAGLPPIYGLYGSLVPLFIYPLLATSKHLSVGPVAIDMLILAAGLGALAGSDAQEKITLAILMTLCVGVFQILMGLFKLGFIFNLFSRPVISGFTSAAPIIIIFSQLGTLFKVETIESDFFFSVGFDLIQNIGTTHWPTFIASLIFIALLVLFKSFTKSVPGSVIVIISTLVSSLFIDFNSLGINLIENIPDGIPNIYFELPEYSVVQEILPTVLTLALVQFMSIASLTKTFARKHRYDIDPNQELIAIGSSNLFGSLFQSIPVSGSFSRSAIAEESGTYSSLSNFFAGLLILFTLLFLTPVFELLPEPLLAAIIIVSVFGLIDLDELKFLINTKRRDAVVALITFLSVLFIGIQEGIIIGLIASVIAILIKLSKPTVAELGVIPDSRVFKNLERFPEAETIDGILILRIDASFSFVNAQFFKNYILEKTLGRENAPEYVIIDGSTISDLDVSAIDSLITVITTLNEHGIELYVSGLIGPVRDVIHSSNLDTFLKSDRFYKSVHDAVEAALKRSSNKHSDTLLGDYRNITKKE